MIRVLSDLELVAKKLDGPRWQLVDDLHYHVGHYDSNEVIIVKKDFITDGASVPLIFRWLIPMDGTWTPIAAVHDALYHYRGVLPVGWFMGAERIYTQKECDQIYLEGMRVLNVDVVRAQLMYRALRIGGWVSWNYKGNEQGR